MTSAQFDVQPPPRNVGVDACEMERDQLTKNGGTHKSEGTFTFFRCKPTCCHDATLPCLLVSHLQRPRSNDGDDDEDDDISLVSRSPSPPPVTEGQAKTGSEWYDDHVKGAIREVITVETKLKPTNIGFALLKKMGWSEGKGLGVSGEGVSFSIV